jgi:peroxin-1
MTSTARKANTSQADLVLLPSLKNCLVNLPSSLVGLLLNSNAVVQNVIVELSFKTASPGQDAKPKNAGTSRSVYLGWTGMRSQTRTGSLVRRDGSGRQDQDIPTVEIDSTYAKSLDLTDGTKV